MKNLFWICIFLFVICTPVFGGNNSFSSKKMVSLTSNINPSRGMFGVTIGASHPFAGDGQVFAANEDYPHGDFGLIAGFDYWKRNLNSFDYHIGLNAKYLQYHFHYSPANEDEITGQFRLLYYSIPFSLNFQIPNYSFLQILGGVAITSMNLFSSQSGAVGSYEYQTLLDLKWAVSPEVFVGINFLEEKTDFMIIRGSINYSTFILRNQSFGVFMTNGNEVLSSARKMNSNKVELQITIYPKWKFKNAVGKDEGVNCPTPF